jgi:hypothetical protein
MDKLEAFAESDGAHVTGIKWQILDNNNRNYLSLRDKMAYYSEAVFIKFLLLLLMCVSSYV